MTEPRNRLREADVDRAIDRAAQELTAGDAPRGFEQAVLDRIHQSRGHGIPWMRLGWAGAAVAAVMIAVVLTRTSTPTPAGDVTTAPKTASATAPTSKPVETPALTSVVEPVRVRRVAGAARRRMLTAASVAVESDAVIAPLQPLEPIAVTPLQAESIVPAPLVIVPLTPIAEVQVSPLSPSIERE
jgi:hypothetical protein